MNKLSKIEEKAEKAIDVFGCILFLLLIISTFFNIFSYWFTGKRFAEFDEISLAIFLWVVFIAAGPLYKRGEHISVAFIVESMRPKVKAVVLLFIDVVVFVTTILVLFYTWKLMMRSFNKYTQVLKLPYAYIDAGVFFGYLTLLVASFVKAILHFKELRKTFSNKEVA